LRELRGEAEQEEVDLSYIRRMVQGRHDVIRAELNRRDGKGSGNLVQDLAAILADEPRGPARGSGRHVTLEPSRPDSHRRNVEALVADVDLSDVAARSPDELAHAMRTLSEEEQTLSAKRREVQAVMDAASAEITRRYRDGEADVDTLLGESSS
ncbi:MAG: aerial mycelium formation protein, partial [Frankiales bacterium]|nr:aerial mycelium formation protein [Frankiales bacterium]